MSEARCHDGLCEDSQDQHWIRSRNGHLSSAYHKELYTVRAWLLVLDLTLPGAEAS